MAKTQAYSPTRRWIFISIYIIFSVVAAYYLQLSRAPRETDVHMQKIFEGGDWQFPGQKVILRRHYTGIPPVDFAASFLVAVFTHGAAGWTKGIQLQQAYFLLQFFPVVATWAVESARKRNAWAIISFIWPLFYQTVGGAIIIPLWYLCYTVTAARPDYWTISSEVPASRARAILPALVLGYLVPTLAGWLPLGFDIETIQALTAFWQITPLVFNLLWWLFTSLSSSAPTKSQQRTLTPLYAVTFIVSLASHVTVLYLCTTSADPTLTLRYIFYPSLPATPAMYEALHFIFQIDFWIIFLATLVWVFQGQLEIITLGHTSIAGPTALVLTAMAALLLSPGAVLSAAWWWREGKIEPKSAVEKKRS